MSTETQTIPDETAELATKLRSYEARVEHVTDRLVPFRDWRSDGMDRALVAGGRFFGIGKRQMRKVVKGRASELRVSSAGSLLFQAIHEAREMRVAADVPDVSDYCGFIYRARLVNFQHIIKIGFTKNPARRIKEIAGLAGTAVDFEHVEPGTLFDEAYLLLVLGRAQIQGEWFFDPSLPIASMPEFLGGNASLGKWQRAAERSLNDVDRTRPIGALAHVYLEMIQNAEAA